MDKFQVEKIIDRVIGVSSRIFKIYEQLIHLDLIRQLNDKTLNECIDNLLLCIQLEDEIINEIPLTKETLQNVIQLFASDCNVFTLARKRDTGRMYHVFHLSNSHYLLYSHYDISKMEMDHLNLQSMIGTTNKNPILRRIMRKILDRFLANSLYEERSLFEKNGFMLVPALHFTPSFYSKSVEYEYTIKTIDYIEKLFLKRLYINRDSQNPLHVKISYMMAFLNPDIESQLIDQKFKYNIDSLALPIKNVRLFYSFLSATSSFLMKEIIRKMSHKNDDKNWDKSVIQIEILSLLTYIDYLKLSHLETLKSELEKKFSLKNTKSLCLCLQQMDVLIAYKNNSEN